MQYFCFLYVKSGKANILTLQGIHIKPTKALLIIAVAAILFTGCSTKKNKWLPRNYHALTTRYNIYFNGNEAWKEGVAMLEKNHVDKYDRMLPVFKFGTVDQTKGIYPQMDKAIKKAETGVTKHGMLIKGKQYNRWTDRCYLLRGKARFYKRDYYAALEDLEFVSGLKRKEEFKYEAQLYLARTYSELAMWADAQSVIDRMKNEKSFPAKLKDKYYAVVADFYLKQGDDSMAIKPLEKAIELSKRRDKKVKARYMFILAQIYQQQKNYKKAGKYYEMARKLHASYDMDFNATLNIARSFDRANGNPKAIRAKLLKMTREDKNSDYLDQIYYALGELSLRDEDEPGAIEDFKTSVRTSTSNANQKGLAYLALGRIYLGHPEYRPAKAYYDSASTSIDKESPEYKRTGELQKSLAELIKNLDIIEIQDSLVALARMDSTERNKKINAFIDLKEKKEREEKIAQQNNTGNNANTNNPFLQNNQNNTNTNTAQGFYFTNQALRASGFSDFKRLWGDRKLEDNWRRSNKQSLAPVQEDSVEVDSTIAKLGNDTVAIKKALREKEYKRIMAALPNTPEDFAKADALILDAYYNAGNIYREQLDDKVAAVKIFEEMLVRFPKDNKYELPTYYQLYRLFGFLGNTAKESVYKDKICVGYPQSDYCNKIKNPQAPTSEKLAKAEAEKFYAETFDLYKKEYYADVVTRTNDALLKYSDKETRPKFAFLRALAIGRTQNVDAFEGALHDVVDNYPMDPVKIQAQYLLDYIAAQKTSNPGVIGDNSQVNTGALTMFSLAPDSAHHYVLLIKNKKTKVNEVKVSISNFDTEFFSLLDLKIESRFLNDTLQMIVVKGFKTQEAATTYFNAIKGDKNALALLGPTDFVQYIITEPNLIVVQQQKSFANYDVFFKEKYKLELPK